MPGFRLIVGAAMFLAGTGCTRAVTAPEVTTLRYTVAAPFCGPTAFTLQFSVDSVAIGTEFLQHGQSSKLYNVPAGSHRIGARVVNWSRSLDTTVTLSAGKPFMRLIDMYCS